MKVAIMGYGTIGSGVARDFRGKQRCCGKALWRAIRIKICFGSA